jgi:hypothetical protein
MVIITQGALWHKPWPWLFILARVMGLNDDDKDVYGLLDRGAIGDHENFTVSGRGLYQGSIF